MITGTKTSSNYSNSLEDILKSNSANLTNKSILELGNGLSNTSSYKKDTFQNVLNLKVEFNKNEDTTQKVYSEKVEKDSKDVKNTDDTDEINEELEKLKKKSKSASKDDINDMLSELLNLLTKLGIKEDSLKGSSDNSLNSIMEKITGLLQDDSVKNKLDANSLKVLEKILGNLSSSIGDDSSGAMKGIKNLMSEISNMLENKQNSGDKVLTLEDMLGKNYSQDGNDGSSTENQSNNSSTSNGSNTLASKEDKFLNSLIDEDKDSSLNKINLFASRVSTIQNQSVNNVRGLTINKSTFIDDLIKDVKFMNTNSLKELTVKINPGNLGEITIKLVQEDGLMKANLKANSKETVALLSQNLSEIKKQLNDQNLKIADVNIELYQDDTTFFREQGFERQFSENQGKESNGGSNNLIANTAITSDEESELINISKDNNLDFFA